MITSYTDKEGIIHALGKYGEFLFWPSEKISESAIEQARRNYCIYETLKLSPFENKALLVMEPVDLEVVKSVEFKWSYFFKDLWKSIKSFKLLKYMGKRPVYETVHLENMSKIVLMKRPGRFHSVIVLKPTNLKDITVYYCKYPKDFKFISEFRLEEDNALTRDIKDVLEKRRSASGKIR